MVVALDQWQVSPHGELEVVEDGILTVSGEIEMPLGHFPRRMTAVRLAGDRSLIFSAIALREPDMRRIEAMGWPNFMVVPSGFHRRDAGIWKQRYPPIRVVVRSARARRSRRWCRSTRPRTYSRTMRCASSPCPERADRRPRLRCAARAG